MVETTTLKRVSLTTDRATLIPALGDSSAKKMATYLIEQKADVNRQCGPF